MKASIGERSIEPPRDHQRMLQHLLRFIGYSANHGKWQHYVSDCTERVVRLMELPALHSVLPCICMCIISRQAPKLSFM